MVREGIDGSRNLVMKPPARLNMCHCFTGRDGRKFTAELADLERLLGEAERAL